ncbi:hypothetical protein B9Z65_4543 [Elsinoe australis]|uniref:Checkpoint protein rad17 n=1 Tax=Elsinoe australis TaxID=40998 RepID=A0A2P8A5B7_9PEZI|nr:hypothetical protein B9Z65_4543 [Elsinoe australis]
MAPTRGSRKTVVISSDEEYGSAQDLEDILTDEESTQPASKKQSESPLKALKDKGKKSGSKKLSSATSSPQKKTKSKAPPPKADGGKSKGTLFSFFNAATQRQQTSSQQSNPPPPKPHSQSEKEDIVDAIEDGEGEVSFVNGSRTVLAARKRKQDDTSHLFDPKAYGAAGASQKFRKTTAGAKVSSTEKEVDRRPWMERFGPVNLEELAVHNKKVKDVRNLIEESLSPRARPRLIVLKGPAGTGKTTTVQLLAQAMNLHIKEWRNPVNVDIGSESFISTSAQFEDFILRSSKFSGLDLTSDPTTSNSSTKPASPSPPGRHILLIEEFPITLTRSSPILLSFRATLQTHLSAPSKPPFPIAPVILILSETLLSSSTSSSDALTPHRLLGPSLLSHHLTSVLEFNPIAPTLLTKALSLTATKESRVSGRRRTPGPAVLAKLAEMGDIRSAVSALEFLCLRGDQEGGWGAKVSFGKVKGRGAGLGSEQGMTEREREALRVVGGREGALGLWHAVGKVVYNKRVDAAARGRDGGGDANGVVNGAGKGDQGGMAGLINVGTEGIAAPPEHLKHLHKSKVPENEPDGLLLELGTDIPTFVAAVHENIIPSCANADSEKTMESIDECLAVMSDADALSVDRFAGSGGGYGSGTAAEGLRQEEIVFHTAVRGSQFWLPYPVKRENSQAEKRRGNIMNWPQSLRLWRGREEMDDLVELVGEEYSKILMAAVNNVDEENDDGLYGLPSAGSKMDVILEMAPYLRLVHEGRRTAGTMRDRVRKVTRFETLHMHGLPGSGGGDVDEEDDEDEELGLKRERRTRTGKGTGDGGFMGLGVEEDVKGLVLSDDDIVDE